MFNPFKSNQQPVRANVVNPDPNTQQDQPRVVAVVPPYSQTGRTFTGHKVVVYDQYGQPLPEVIFPG